MNAEERPITDADLAELVQRMDEAAGAFIKGDIDHYLSLFDHADDYSLMGPTGGETVHGFDSSGERLAEFRSFFTAGTAWGTVRIAGRQAELRIEAGELTLRRLEIGERAHDFATPAVIRPGHPLTVSL